MSLSPTQRTLAMLRDRGCLAEITEQRVRSHITRDLFGFIDVVALEPGQPGCLAVQTTTGDHVSHRLTKIREECNEAALAWLKAGNRIEVHGWRRLKVKRGGKAMRWVPRVVEVTLEDLG